MPIKESCRNCQYCCPGQASTLGWCRLRKIKLHQEIAAYAFCHHWTRKAPSLPKLLEKQVDPSNDRQLELTRVLVAPEP